MSKSSERVRQEFTEKIKEIETVELLWENKTADVIEICELFESIESTEDNPRVVFQECPDIINKLDKIEESMKPMNLQFINSVSLMAAAEGSELSFELLKKFLANFIDFIDYKTIQYFK